MLSVCCDSGMMCGLCIFMCFGGMCYLVVVLLNFDYFVWIIFVVCMKVSVIRCSVSWVIRLFW